MDRSHDRANEPLSTKIDELFSIEALAREGELDAQQRLALRKVLHNITLCVYVVILFCDLLGLGLSRSFHADLTAVCRVLDAPRGLCLLLDALERHHFSVADCGRELRLALIRRERRRCRLQWLFYSRGKGKS